MKRDEEIRAALTKHADDIRTLALEYGAGVSQEQEAFPRNQLQYDLISASNNVRKTAKRVARPAAKTAEEEVEKLRAELRAQSGKK